MNPACRPEAFEQRYRAQRDPWNFRTSQYERFRYETLVAALPRRHHEFGYEPGCSIGELTALLAPHCERLLATDVSATAVARARERCAPFPQVQVECADVLSTVPPAAPDLIVLSELAYYFEVEPLRNLACLLETALRPGGLLIAAHWLGHSADHVLHGDEAHETLLGALSLCHLSRKRYPGFRIDLWRRA